MITALQHNMSQRGVRREAAAYFPPQHRASRTQRSDASQQRRSRPLTASQLSSTSLDKRAARKRASDSNKSSFVRLAQAYKKSRSCMLFTSIVTLASCVFFVAGTYIELKILVIIVEVVFALVFFVDYVLSLFAEPVPLGYALSFSGIVDLMSIAPVFGLFKRWLYSLSFVRYLRLGKVTRVMQNHRLLDKFGSFDDVTVNACLLGLKVAGLIFMTTAIIYGTEQSDRDDESAFSDPGMQWHDALYFTIVTLSTVGYGDVLPLTAFSRMLVVVVILFALTYVPLEVGNLVDVISSRPKNRSGFPMSLVGGHLHVVLAMVSNEDEGPDCGFEPRSLRRMIEELCHEDHGMDNESLWVVVMAPCPPSPEVQLVVRSPRFMSRVIYYRGSVMDPLDMAAVCAEYADCIFLYPGSAHSPTGALATEEKTTLAAKALQRYLDRTPTDDELMKRVTEQSVMNLPCRTLVTVKDLRSKNQLLRFGIDHVICHDELKMSILACATLFPAFLPFAINAMRSSSDQTTPEHAGGTRENPPGRSEEPAETEDGSPSSSWLQDYKSGMEYEVYSLPLSVGHDSYLQGKQFSRAALDLFKESKGEVLLMAVVRDMRNLPDQDIATAAAAAAATITATTANTAAPGGGGGSATSMDEHERFRSKSDVTEPTGHVPRSRSSGSKARSVGGRVSGSSAGGGRKSGCGGKDVKSFVHASIFPGENFSFTSQVNVLVLAEDKEKAQFHLGQLQAKKATLETWPHQKGSGCDGLDVGHTVNALISGPELAAEWAEDNNRSTLSPIMSPTMTTEGSTSRSGGDGDGGGGGGGCGVGSGGEGSVAGKGIVGGNSAGISSSSSLPASRGGVGGGGVGGEVTGQDDEKEDAGALEGDGDPSSLAAAAPAAAAAAAGAGAAGGEVAAGAATEREAAATMRMFAPVLAAAAEGEGGTATMMSAEVPAHGGEELSLPTPVAGTAGAAGTASAETPSAAGADTANTTTASSAENQPPALLVPPPPPLGPPSGPPGRPRILSSQLSSSSGNHSRLLAVFPNKSLRGGMDASGLSLHRDSSGRSVAGNGGAPSCDGQVDDPSSRGGVTSASARRCGGSRRIGGAAVAPGFEAGADAVVRGAGVGVGPGVGLGVGGAVIEEGVGAEDGKGGVEDGGGGGDVSRGIRRIKSRKKTTSTTNSLTGACQTDAEAARLLAVREEMRNEDGASWTSALKALKTATGQLNALEKESGLKEEIVAEDPGAFFSKVTDAARTLEDALRVQAATVPDDLSGHFVVIGAHPRLQHYVVALRRQRPSVVIVVVTDTEEIFFELRERLAEFKCEEGDLNVSKIYSVFGKRQDRATFAEARVKHAETVLLVSDETSDSDVLLVSFELEQMLEEMDPRANSPKVLIDLHNDNSIYYCGNSLGGKVSGPLRRASQSGRPNKEAPNMTASGVWEWPLFAAGRVWTESIMEVFAVQTYFSSEFLAFFETVLQIRRPVLLGSELVHEDFYTAHRRVSSSLVNASTPSEDGCRHPSATAGAGAAGAGGGAATAGAGAGAGADPGADPGLPRGQFDQLRVVSSKYRGETYKFLAEELITRGAMPLGLYRPSGTKGSTLAYTHVNPDVSEPLVSGDIVFVLRSRSCPLVGWV